MHAWRWRLVQGEPAQPADPAPTLATALAPTDTSSSAAAARERGDRSGPNLSPTQVESMQVWQADASLNRNAVLRGDPIVWRSEMVG